MPKNKIQFLKNMKPGTLLQTENGHPFLYGINEENFIWIKKDTYILFLNKSKYFYNNKTIILSFLSVNTKYKRTKIIKIPINLLARKGFKEIN